MNQLKHIFGANVPRSAPANALPSCRGQHASVYFKRRQFKYQLSIADSLVLAKRCHSIDIKHSRPFHQDGMRLLSKASRTIYKQRNKTRSSVASFKKSPMEKRWSLESISQTADRSAVCQNVKFNSNLTDERYISQNFATINNNDITNRKSSFVACFEKHPRSYAEIIADYSEAIYGGPTAGVQNNNTCFHRDIRRSPFSTSPTPVSKKIPGTAENAGVSVGEPGSNRSLLADARKLFDRYIQYGSVETTRRHSPRIIKAMSESIGQDYVTTGDSKNEEQFYAKLVARCSKSMHNNFPGNDRSETMIDTLARNSIESFSISTKNSATLNTMETSRNAVMIEKDEEEQINLQDDWLREVEETVNDLNKIAKENCLRVSNIPKLKESDIARYTDRSCKSLRRVMKSHRRKENDVPVKKLIRQSNTIYNVEKHKINFNVQQRNYLLSNNKAADLPQYLRNVAKMSSTSARKDSTQLPMSGRINDSKQPQVELRMVPSEKESVVSINVDSASVRMPDTLNRNAEHLSVVVQSDQKRDAQLAGNQWNSPTFQRSTKSASQRSNFGPMRISISEDSAPVKQIEFSINGKPVSELKSITARTERLDVVSSVDKIEIRIPFTKDDTNAPGKTRQSDLSKGIDSSMEQILNVQISANFQNRSPKEIAEPSYDAGINAVPTSSPHSVKNHYTFKNTNEDPRRNDTCISNNTQQIQSRDLNTIKTNNTRETSSSNIRKDKSFDSRIPSKTIPWWSSSDSFRRIKKKENDRKSIILPHNLNEKKLMSNSMQNCIANTLKSGSEEASGPPKVLTRKIQSANETIIVRNNPVALSKTIKNETNVNEISKVNRKNVFATTFKARSTQREHSVNMKADTHIGKASGLPRRFNAPSNAQDVSFNEDREKKYNYLLKQTESIDDVLTTNPKTRQTLEIVKPLEKRKDDILIDYNFKVPSRKPTVKLNDRRITKMQSLSTTIEAKDVMSKQLNAKVTLKNEKIENVISRKQINMPKIATQTQLSISKKLEEKTNIIKQKEKIMVKNVANSADANIQKKNIKETAEVNKYDIKTSKQYLKSSTEFREDRPNNIRNKKSSSGTIKNQGSDNLRTDPKTQILVNKELSSDDKESHSHKLKLDKDKNVPLKPTDSSKNPNGPNNLKLSKLEMNTKSRIKPNNDCTYGYKSLIVDSSHATYDKNDTLSKSNTFILKTPQNFNNGILKDRAPIMTGSAILWNNMDRPENNSKKLF